MSLPKKIKVISMDYTIKPAEASWVRETESRGQCCTDTQTITVPKTDIPCQTLDTVMHEVFHAVFDVMQLTDDDKEEAYVSRMATGFTAVLRDNPKFRNWLFGQLKKLDGE
jgi:hypothetical protein